MTLLKHQDEGTSKAPADEQFHVLPMYLSTGRDENGSIPGHYKRVEQGAVEIRRT